MHRTKVETGECELCCAYEKGDSLQISLWSKFSDAIAKTSASYASGQIFFNILDKD
ncbi:MAG: hypothetical protein WBB28_22910 [Crinalium sp.]